MYLLLYWNICSVRHFIIISFPHELKIILVVFPSSQPIRFKIHLSNTSRNMKKVMMTEKIKIARNSSLSGLRASRLPPSLPSSPTPTPPFLRLTTAELAILSLLPIAADFFFVHISLPDTYMLEYFARRWKKFCWEAYNDILFSLIW